jgi:L-threonylcarbamoyladenylate synthase
MMQRHYAPTTPLECHTDSWRRIKELCQAGQRIGWLVCTQPPDEPLCGLFTIELSSDPADYSAGLYAALHTLEAMRLDRIVVELPPEGDAWLAVRDRLRRAATPPGEIG